MPGRIKNCICRNCDKPFLSRQCNPIFCSKKCFSGYRMLRPEDRLWKRVDKSGDCWVWTGSCKPDGYGRLNSKLLGERTAHRISYRIAYGDIPNGLHVLHRCDNPACVRPDHLFLGTNQDNVDDKVAKGRLVYPVGKTGSENPCAKLTESQVEEIIQTYNRGGMRQKDIATLYGVCQATVSNIITKKTWIDTAADDTSRLIDYLKKQEVQRDRRIA